MLKYFEILWIVLAVATTVMIFSFSAKDAVDSSAQSRAISNTIVDVIEKTTHKTIGELSGKSDKQIRAIIRRNVRKTAHFIEFMLLGMTVFAALFFSRHEKKYFTALCIGICTATVDESIQMFSVGRAALFGDIAIDTLGTAVGIAIGILVLKLIKRLCYARALH